MLRLIRELHAELRSATVAWAHGVEPAPSVAAARHRAIALLHEHYVRSIPRYREIAEARGLGGPASVELVVEELLLHDVFKSYGPALLATLDFAALTEWLGTIFTRVPRPDLDGVSTLSGWRDRLRADGGFLSFSSGTSGKMAFVPRDHDTFRALCTNGATYTDEGWRRRPDGTLEEFDCLVAGPRSGGMGILDAGGGLARTAARSRFLFDEVLTADAVRGTGEGTRALRPDEAAALGAAEFLRRATDEGRKLLVFGAPFQVKWLCEELGRACGRLETTPGSLVVTGGGWKSFRGESIRRADLLALVRETLGVPPERCIDAYSTSELNCTFRTCARGAYHVPPLLEPVVLDETMSGSVGGEGEGTLAFLDPFALSYPGFVITGDQAVLRRGRCACGLPGPVLEGEICRAPGMEVRGCGGVPESARV